MTFRDNLLEQLQNEIEKCELELNKRKHNIHKDYLMAKQDFTVIDNYTDCIYVYDKIVEELKNLQERIIKRNKE